MTSSPAPLYTETTTTSHDDFRVCATCKMSKPIEAFAFYRGSNRWKTCILCRQQEQDRVDAALRENPPSSKICRECGQSKPFDEFYRSSAGKDGYESRCMLCTKDYLKGWEAKRKERFARRDKSEINPLRKCSSCKLLQPIEHFVENIRGVDGLSSQCRSCKNRNQRDKWDMGKDAPRPFIDEDNSFAPCHKCNVLKSLVHFYRNPINKSGYGTICKECISIDSKKRSASDPEYQYARHRKWSDANAEKLRENAASRAPQVKTPEDMKYLDDRHFWEFGVNREWFENELNNQNGTCAICGTDTPGGVGRFHIDHNHNCCGDRRACNRCRRGLLCSKCNLRLGILEKTDWVKKAKAYLRKYPLKDAAGHDQPTLFDDL